jgi:hypothetical protein
MEQLNPCLGHRMVLGWCWLSWDIWLLMVIDGYVGYGMVLSCSIIVKYGLSENGNYHHIAPIFCGSLIRICGIHGMVIDALMWDEYAFRSLFQGG